MRDNTDPTSAQPDDTESGAYESPFEQEMRQIPTGLSNAPQRHRRRTSWSPSRSKEHIRFVAGCRGRRPSRRAEDHKDGEGR